MTHLRDAEAQDARAAAEARESAGHGREEVEIILVRARVGPCRGARELVVARAVVHAVVLRVVAGALAPPRSGEKNRGFWWVVIDLEGDLDVDELVKRVGTSLRVK